MSQQRQGGDGGGRPPYQRNKKRPPYNGCPDPTAGGMFPNMTRYVLLLIMDLGFAQKD